MVPTQLAGSAPCLPPASQPRSFGEPFPLPADPLHMLRSCMGDRATASCCNLLGAKRHQVAAGTQRHPHSRTSIWLCQQQKCCLTVPTALSLVSCSTQQEEPGLPGPTSGGVKHASAGNRWAADSKYCLAVACWQTEQHSSVSLPPTDSAGRARAWRPNHAACARGGQLAAAAAAQVMMPRPLACAVADTVRSAPAHRSEGRRAPAEEASGTGVWARRWTLPLGVVRSGSPQHAGKGLGRPRAPAPPLLRVAASSRCLRWPVAL